MVNSGSRWSRNDSLLRSSGTRRTATVTISAPEARCAAFISSKLRYFPVPMISRDVNARSPISNFSVGATAGVDMTELYSASHYLPTAQQPSSATVLPPDSSSADEMHNFNNVAVFECNAWPLSTTHYLVIDFNSNLFRFKAEINDQLRQGEILFNFLRFAVNLNAHSCSGPHSAG